MEIEFKIFRRIPTVKPLKICCLILLVMGFGSSVSNASSEMTFREIMDRHYANSNFYMGGTTGWKKKSRTSGLINREFNYITPENDFKHQMVHPKPGVWNWEAADAWIANAAEHNQVIRIHGPISPQCSTWAKEDDRTAKELETSLVDFMTTLCKRYNDCPQVKWMDVVNETLQSGNGKWFSSKPGVEKWENPWTLLGYDTSVPLQPPLYIKKAFEIANEHAPNIKLIINQHGSLKRPTWLKIFQTVDYLRAQGLRVDGIGWQAHVNVGWEKKKNNIQLLTALIKHAHSKNLSFHITEKNVWLKEEVKNYEAQADTFSAILRVLLSQRSNGEVTWNLWNLSDADSWREMRAFDGCIFDRDYKPKPAYYALQKVLLEMQ
jgi:GH35 family endo-1,4-beta-xylanase